MAMPKLSRIPGWTLVLVTGGGVAACTGRAEFLMAIGGALLGGILRGWLRRRGGWRRPLGRVVGLLGATAATGLIVYVGPVFAGALGWATLLLLVGLVITLSLEGWSRAGLQGAAFLSLGVTLVLVVAGAPFVLLLLGAEAVVQIAFWLAGRAEGFSGSVPGARRARIVCEAGGLGFGGSLLPLVVGTCVLAAILYLTIPRGALWTAEDRQEARIAPRRISADPHRPDVVDGEEPTGGPLTVRRWSPGFTNEPLLRGMGRNIDDNTVVMAMRCTFADGAPYSPPGALYLRGMVLDQYEDGRWRATGELEVRGDADDGRADGWVTVAEIPEGVPRIHQRVVISDPATSALFAVAYPEAFEVDSALVGEGPIARLPHRPSWSIAYRARSAVSEPDMSAVRSAPLPELSTSEDGRVASLARSLVGPREGLYEACRSIAAHLRSSYTYDVTAPPIPPDTDPVEAFLFERRSGVCTHYASAMVELVRRLGARARLAGGYCAVERGPTADSWVVRRRDAHTWVEIHFGPEGWIAFDPTPAQGGSRPGGGPSPDELAENASRWRGGALARWMAAVEGFGAVHQRRGLRWMGRAVSRYWWILPLAIGAQVAISLWRRRTRAAGPARLSSEGDMDAVWGAFRRLCRERGVIPRREQTPRELGRRAQLVLPSDEVDALVRRYCRMRYGGAEVDASRERCEEALARLRASAGTGEWSTGPKT
jgi:transglutaminase-like putative cysteine protease